MEAFPPELEEKRGACSCVCLSVCLSSWFIQSQLASGQLGRHAYRFEFILDQNEVKLGNNM